MHKRADWASAKHNVTHFSRMFVVTECSDTLNEPLGWCCLLSSNTDTCKKWWNAFINVIIYMYPVVILGGRAWCRPLCRRSSSCSPPFPGIAPQLFSFLLFPTSTRTHTCLHAFTTDYWCWLFSWFYYSLLMLVLVQGCPWGGQRETLFGPSHYGGVREGQQWSCSQ